MPVSVTMPRLGESVTEGTVTRWLKQEGERVDVDEPLLEVSTDKVDTEIPSPAAGVLTKIVVGEDQTAEVGSELAVIAGDGESADGAAGDSAADRAGADQAAPARGGGDEAGAAASGDSGQAGDAAAPGAAYGGPAPAGAPAEQAGPQDGQAAASGAGSPAAAPDGDGSAGAGASTVVRMPALGESVTEGTVTRWLKQVGERVDADEPLLEVSTDKVDTEIPSPATGTLLEIKVDEDGTVAVGAELAVIGAESAGAAGQDAGGNQPPAQAAQDAAPQRSPAQSRPGQDAPAQRPAGQEAPARPAASAPPPQAVDQPARAVDGRSFGPGQATPTDATADGGADEEGGGYLTPLVRRLAAEQGVDVRSVRGTGVGGRIRKQDVLDAAERARAERARAEQARTAQTRAGQAATAPTGGQAAGQTSPLRGRTEKLSRMRALIARRMVESLQISAQLTTVVEVDVTKIARLRERAKADFLATHGVKLTFLPFFALAAVEALRAHPTVNASIDLDAGTVTYHDAEHLGVAVDTERGLLVPVIHDAGDLNLAGLAKRISDVAERTRTNKISPDELSGGTFTLTNTGSRGALFDTPIINQPQVAILGTGAVVKRAVVVDDPDLGELILPRSMLYLALSYDHRLVDGADAARFLSTIKDRLETGSFDTELGLS